MDKTQYSLTIDFGTSQTEEQVKTWFDKILSALPDEAIGIIDMKTLHMDLDDNLDDVVGSVVSFDSPTYGVVRGELDAVFTKAGGTGKVLVVAGNAYPMNFGKIEIHTLQTKEEIND